MCVKEARLRGDVHCLFDRERRRAEPLAQQPQQRTGVRLGRLGIDIDNVELLLSWCRWLWRLVLAAVNAVDGPEARFDARPAFEMA